MGHSTNSNCWLVLPNVLARLRRGFEARLGLSDIMRPNFWRLSFVLSFSDLRMANPMATNTMATWKMAAFESLLDWTGQPTYFVLAPFKSLARLTATALSVVIKQSWAGS